MKRIGILSDTHGSIHPRVTGFFSEVDEIWHAGDVGDIRVIRALRERKPVRAVYGNIDGRDVRSELPGTLLFQVEDLKVLITHIGGYPGRYDRIALAHILRERPGLFVCGHSHILRVMFDEGNDLLFINPGAAGHNGLHKSVTAIRLMIEGKNMKNLEVLDIPRSTGG